MKIERIYKGLTIYNLAVIIICGIAFGQYGLPSFLMYALPGVLIASVGVVTGNQFKKRVHTGGIIGLMVWIAASVIFSIWLITNVD